MRYGSVAERYFFVYLGFFLQKNEKTRIFCHFLRPFTIRNRRSNAPKKREKSERNYDVSADISHIILIRKRLFNGPSGGDIFAFAPVVDSEKRAWV